MSEAKVTVLMPAHNAEKYIAEAISSVLAQTFTAFELLVVDDGSTDKTNAVIDQFNDNRIRLIRQPHSGVALTLNKGLQEAQGEYIARFDADDICLPGRLQAQADFLNSHPDYVLTGSDAEYISENGEHLFDFSCMGHSHEEIVQHFYEYCPFIHSAVMFRKEAVLKTGGYSAHSHNFEDYLLWTQLLKYGKYNNIPQQLIRVRFNPESVTIDEKWRGRRFRELKKAIILRGSVTPAEGKEILTIIQKQDIQKIKKASYYALCGKKFLVNNHQPRKAREQLAKAIHYYPSRLDNYLLYLASYFPKSFIHWLHNKEKNYSQ
jgi:glycosyltransferase involved in cell wall biosynthesis